MGQVFFMHQFPMSFSKYADHRSTQKEDNVLSIYRALRHYKKEELAALKVVCLSGPQLHDVSFLVREGLSPDNIAVVEMNPATVKLQQKKIMSSGTNGKTKLTGVAVIGPITVGEHLAACPTELLPDVLYLDYLANWTGSARCFPMADLYEYLTRARACKNKVIVALTFPVRNNYRRGCTDVRSAVIKSLRLRTTGKGPGEHAVVGAFLRRCVFPHSGWRVKACRVSLYKRKRGGQQMMFFRFVLTKTIPNEDVDWPLIDGEFVGFPPEEGERWSVHSLVDL
jgi:hypothetical protein